MPIEDFITKMVGISFLTIVIIYFIVNSKNAVRWYLRLKSPSQEIDLIIDRVFKKNMLNELLKKWISFERTKFFLKFQLVVLLNGFLLAIGVSILATGNAGFWNTIIITIATIGPLIVAMIFLSKLISKTFRIPEKKLEFSEGFLIFSYLSLYHFSK